MRIGILLIPIGIFLTYKYNYKMSLKEYRKYALYMAVLDDEISRNELEGNMIGNETIEFPNKIDTLEYKYNLFLEMNRKKSKKQIEDEISTMEVRLEESKKYLNAEKEKLEVEFTNNNQGDTKIGK